MMVSKSSCALYLSTLFLLVACSETEIVKIEPCEVGSGQIYLLVESMPKFEGCRNSDYDCEEKSFKEFVNKNLRYPEEAKKNGIEGEVVISMIIEKEGCASSEEIIESVGYGCDKEAIRLIQNMPRWQPGTIDGEPQRVKKIMRIEFRS
jgi:protein TonB